MKVKGWVTYLLVWIITSVLLGALFSAINSTGQSLEYILFVAIFFGFCLTLIIWFFGNVVKTRKEVQKNRANVRQYKKTGQPGQRMPQRPAGVPQNKGVKVHSVPYVTTTVQKQGGPQNELITSKISDDVKSLLWIKGAGQKCDDNLVNEPSLIDEGLEIRFGDKDAVQDIGYYPSYRNLSPENRFIYLKWLENITEPIPIGFVFIFYYGLERHLLFGKYEQAFEMVIRLQQFHKNASFYAYSSDALLIAALYHKRADFISKIDLNKAAPNLSQFVVAALTGRIDSDSLIANCKAVGFTNPRYIKNDFELFNQVLNEILNEKFGCPYYPIEEADFLKCKGMFQLVLANYSLKLDDRIHDAPDITTNEEYKKNVFEILSETHEKVKAIKKVERSQNNT